MRAFAVLLVFVLACAAPLAARADEHPSLARARALYNAGDYDGAIAAAGVARGDAASANAAALVAARAHLERFRHGSSDPADLALAREALAGIQIASLQPRDQIDLLVGLGQALFVTGSFGAAAELFEGALGRSTLLAYRDRALLLDWWASAIDRDTHSLPPERRTVSMQRVVTRMEDELAGDPALPAANYWLAVAAHGSGRIDRAWNAAVAAWVRASLRPESAQALRQDLDRFVTDVLMPDLARQRPGPEQAAALADLRAEWDATKERWK